MAARIRPLACFFLIAASLVLTYACSQPSQGADAAQGQDSPDGDTPQPDAVLVRAAPVRLDTMVALYSTSATLRASQHATVTARTRGVIRRLAVEEGDRVSADQPLAYLEDEEQKIAFERTQATLDTRRWEFERSVSLFEQELVSEEANERARREARDAEQAAALAQLELSRTIIRAPFDGVVLTRHLDVGNTIGVGDAVYSIADTTRLLADVNVPERHVARLAPGQSVRLTADATRDEVEARIERIAPAVDAATGTVKVTVAVPGGHGLRPGSFVRVDVVTDTHPQALVVPRSALLAEGRRWFLYQVVRDEAASEEGMATVRRIEVGLGFEAEDRVEITPSEEPAIRDGDRVVVVGVGALCDGARIEIADAEADHADS